MIKNRPIYDDVLVLFFPGEICLDVSCLAGSRLSLADKQVCLCHLGVSWWAHNVLGICCTVGLGSNFISLNGCPVTKFIGNILNPTLSTVGT